MLTVDGFGEDTCARRLAHATGTAEEIGMRQLAALYGIAQRRGERFLAHYRCKGLRTILPCRNNIIVLVVHYGLIIIVCKDNSKRLKGKTIMLFSFVFLLEMV